MADYAIHDTTLTGISNVIRKKEGSSALIDPAEYAERINYMGMLEKKIIVSSPICDFSDGSDDVPTDSVKIFIPANLDGKSSVSEKQTGRNLLNDSIKTKVGGSILFAGASSSSDVNIILPAGTYTMTLKLNVNINVNLYLKDIDTNTNITGFPYYNTASTEPKSRTFTLDHTTRLCAWTYNGDFTSTSEVDYCMIEFGSTAHSYEHYVSPTTYSANLGRTVYGAEVDLVTGTGKETYAEIDMGDLTWTYDSTYNRFISSSLPDCIKIDTARTTPILCSAYQVISDGRPISQVPDKSIYLSFHSSGSQLTDAFVHDSDYTDATAFKTAVTGQKIVYQLKDSAQTDFTFDGQRIPTRLGYNCFISEQGDTSVAYRASGTITIIPPALISKTITANGTYSAEDDNADGYDEVTVNVPRGTPFKYEDVVSSGLPSVFVAMEEGNYLCVIYCSYDGTRTFSTTGTLIFEEDINVADDSRGIKVALCHLLPTQQISHQATTVSLYNSRLQAIIRLDDSISVSQMVDSYCVNDGNTSGYTPSYSGNVLSVAVCGGDNTEHFYDKTIPRDSAIENSVNGGLNSILHIGYGTCPNYDMYGYYGNGVYIGLFQ